MFFCCLYCNHVDMAGGKLTRVSKWILYIPRKVLDYKLFSSLKGWDVVGNLIWATITPKRMDIN